MKKILLILGCGIVCVSVCIAFAQMCFGGVGDANTADTVEMPDINWYGYGAEEIEHTKPYLHKDPNDHWTCSKHGDLELRKRSDSISYPETISISTSGKCTTYCEKCFWGTINDILNEHITGVEK